MDREELRKKLNSNTSMKPLEEPCGCDIEQYTLNVSGEIFIAVFHSDNGNDLGTFFYQGKGHVNIKITQKEFEKQCETYLT